MGLNLPRKNRKGGRRVKKGGYEFVSANGSAQNAGVVDTDHSRVVDHVRTSKTPRSRNGKRASDNNKNKENG